MSKFQGSYTSRDVLPELTAWLLPGKYTVWFDYHSGSWLNDTWLWTAGCGVQNTRFIHQQLIEHDDLEQFLGSLDKPFSFLYYTGSYLYLCRGKGGQLFIDDELNVASEDFPNSRPLDAGVLWRIDLESKQLKHSGIAFSA